MSFFPQKNLRDMQDPPYVSPFPHCPHCTLPRQRIFGFETGPDRRGAGNAAGVMPVPVLLPPTIRDEGRDRLLRRSEHNARARAHAAKVAGYNESERIKARDEFRREKFLSRRNFLDALRDREERWVYKTQDSPFYEDLWAEDDRIFHLNISRNKEMQIQP
eukprot:s530_g7.t1